MRVNNWNDKPQLSDLQWGGWLGGDNSRIPYIQLYQNFDERHRDCFEITIRKLTHHLSCEEDFDKMAMECNVVMIENIDKVDTKPYGFVQRSMESWINKQHLCVCCGDKWDCDFGHNPAPAGQYGRCCDSCNMMVIGLRFREAGLGMNVNFNSNNDDPNVSDAEVVSKAEEITETEGFKILLTHLMDEQMSKRGINWTFEPKKW